MLRRWSADALRQHPIRIADSTPVPCGMSRETALRSDLDSWAGYGYCASHFKGQLDLEQHGGRTITGVAVRILQRILALTAAIWHNWHTSQPVLRSPVAYDH